MAFKAVDFDTDIAVTRLTKLPIVIDRYWVVIVVLLNMAINTTLEAELFATNAVDYGEITLMIEKIHVVSSHLINGRHTTIAFAFRNDRQFRQCSRYKQRHKNHGEVYRLSTGKTHSYLPSPISI